MGGNSDAGDSAFAVNGSSAAALGGDSAMGAPSTDGGSSADSSGTRVLHSQRRSLTPMKRVESRVPVNDVQEQPLLQQARKILDDQRSKYRESTQGFGWYDWLGFFLPCFVWLRTYDWRHWLL
ncbi:hypothetical protein ABPG75_002410, partial [Micractinium tetrahymenae]